MKGLTREDDGSRRVEDRRVIALVSAFNEADILGHVLEHLIGPLRARGCVRTVRGRQDRDGASGSAPQRRGWSGAPSSTTSEDSAAGCPPPRN